jgi:exodeoxyribonuclease V alpha subunit
MKAVSERYFGDLQVTGIRSVGRTGGCIASTKCITTGEEYVLVLNYSLCRDGREVKPSQVWEIDGKLETRTRPAGKYSKNEVHVVATKANLVSCIGENIVDYLVKNVPGIGPTKARRLVDLAKSRKEPLESIISRDARDILLQVIGSDVADNLVQSFKDDALLEQAFWLDRFQIPRPTARRIVDYWGEGTRSKLDENPYRMLSFGASWGIVDALAIEQFGCSEDDARRLRAAVHASLQFILQKRQSTVASKAELSPLIKKKLGNRELTDKALDLTDSNRDFVVIGETYCPAGAWLIEKKIANYVKLSTGSESTPHQISFSANKVDIDAIIARFEEDEGISLAQAQRQAVLVSSENRLSMIIGGAGTGKTTVLKCLYRTILEREPYTHIYQMALSGIAAKRMKDKTGFEATSIAAFIYRIQDKDIPYGSWFIIDEASMVDIQSMGRIIDKLPPGSNVVLVGDDYQMQPVGPGLVMHALVDLQVVPQTKLEVVMRQSEESGIPMVASSVRNGKVPDLPIITEEEVSSTQGVALLPADEHLVEEIAARAYGALSEKMRCQILAATKTGIGSCKNLNIRAQSLFNKSGASVGYIDSDFGDGDVIPFLDVKSGGFRVGDPIIFSRNDYDRGLRNGSMGVITKAYLPSDAMEPVLRATFEEHELDLYGEDLSDIDKAYAVTVHKAQGSEFDSVIVVLKNSNLIELSWIYTAITRGVEAVILVGDRDIMAKAIACGRGSSKRKTSLGSMLSLDGKISVA